MPERLRLLIVDDEPLARMRLRSLLADVAAGTVEIVGEAGSGTEALHLLSQLAVDVLLLDIHMPGLDGLALAERLRSQARPPAVVFVTAHAEHALRAFELAAVDYLTKPVRRERLLEALRRASVRVAQAPVPLAPPPAPRDRPMLVVSDRGRVLRIPVADVVYLRAEMKYVTLHTREHSYVLDDSLGELEERLGGAVIRTHRSVLVARDAVRRLERRPAGEADDGAESAGEGGEGWAVQVAPQGDWLPVSRRQLAAVREALAAGA